MIAGVIFDKDGTLFDFNATWGRWTVALVEDLVDGDEPRARALAGALGFDMDAARFMPDSPVISCTPDEIAEAALPHLPGHSPASLVARMNVMSATNQQVPALPLAPLFEALRGRGLRLGLATNDAEEAAHAHLAAAGIAPLFDFVAGFDSGHGGKPAPGMLLAFAEQFGLDPAQVVMVGDSRHDLIAGRAAGMRTLAVLTGVARAEDLAPLADAVLPDIGHIPRWLDAQDDNARA